MSMTGPEPANVENPTIGWLQALKASVETARAGVPDIEAPTKSIGPGPAWTGTKADETHHTLAGMAPTLKAALNDLAADVQDAIAAVHPKKMTAQEAHFLLNDHMYNNYN
jgi:hypothetical protein